MDLHLADKTVIVTGAGSNIGRDIAHSFANEKANVVIAEWDEPQGKKVAQEIMDMGGKALFVQTDVANNEQVTLMAQKVIAEFGKIDILINNVGWGVDQLFMQETREKWKKMVDINFWGVINCTRAVLDQMIEQKSGSVVTIGSDAGRMGEYYEAVYSGCKGGVIALTKALAREVGKMGIRLNVVCPGATVPESKDAVGEKSLWNEMFDVFTPEIQTKAAKTYPLRKLGKPQDIANAVLFIASERAGHITGQILSVSGGYTMM